jgi:cytochrome P450
MNFFNSYRTLKEYRRDPLEFMKKKFHEQGDFIRLNIFGKKIYIVSNPNLVVEVLKTKHQFYSKGRTTKMLKKFLGSGLITNDDIPSWRKQHRLIRPLMNPKSIFELAPKIDSIAEDFIQSLASKDEINGFHEMNRLTWRVILKTLFSQEPTPEMDLWLEDILELMEIITRKTRSLIPLPFWLPTKDHRRLREIIEKFDHFVLNLIRSRRNSQEKRDDLIQLLINAKEDDLVMSDLEIRDEIMTFLMAGHETITNTMSWLLIETAHHPEIGHFVRDEVEAFLSLKNYQDLFNARKMNSVLDEVMRLWPSVWVFMRQAEGVHQLGSHEISKGANVVLAPILSHRSPKLWEDPEEFKWERFLDKKQMHPGAFYPFGVGPRACIGMYFAYMEAKIIYSHLIHSYEWSIVNQEPQEWVAGITLRPKNNLRLKLKNKKI